MIAFCLALLFLCALVALFFYAFDIIIFLIVLYIIVKLVKKIIKKIKE